MELLCQIVLSPDSARQLRVHELDFVFYHVGREKARLINDTSALLNNKRVSRISNSEHIATSRKLQHVDHAQSRHSHIQRVVHRATFFKVASHPEEDVADEEACGYELQHIDLLDVYELLPVIVEYLVLAIGLQDAQVVLIECADNLLPIPCLMPLGHPVHVFFYLSVLFILHSEFLALFFLGIYDALLFHVVGGYRLLVPLHDNFLLFFELLFFSSFFGGGF